MQATISDHIPADVRGGLHRQDDELVTPSADRDAIARQLEPDTDAHRLTSMIR